MPVGKHFKLNESFTLKSTPLQKGDIVYTLTDGFQDQFGGEQETKFLSKRLKELVLSIASLPMETQKEKLSETFNLWKGANRQIDDVCVIGLKI